MKRCIGHTGKLGCLTVERLVLFEEKQSNLPYLLRFISCYDKELHGSRIWTLQTRLRSPGRNKPRQEVRPQHPGPERNPGREKNPQICSSLLDPNLRPNFSTTSFSFLLLFTATTTTATTTKTTATTTTT